MIYRIIILFITPNCIIQIQMLFNALQSWVILGLPGSILGLPGVILGWVFFGHPGTCTWTWTQSLTSLMMIDGLFRTEDSLTH